MMYYGLINSMNRLAPSNPLWNNLKSYWTFDNTPNDSKSYANGTLIGGLGYSTGKINNGLIFDGVNDYLDLPNDKFKDDVFSIAFWIKRTNTGVQSVFSNLTLESSFKGYFVSVLSGSVSVYFYNNGTNVITSSYSLPYDLWANVVITVNKSGNYKMYLNGSLVVNQSCPAFNFPSVAHHAIGELKSGTVASPGLYYYFADNLDELSYFNAELTLSQVSELYNSGSGLQYVP